MLGRIASSLMFERPTRNKTMATLAAKVRDEGIAIDARCNGAADSEQNRKYLSHIIGIERWGQQRMKVALGEPFIEEEYDGYRPKRDVGWEDLKDQFNETRRETIELIQQIEKTGVSAETQVNHNDFGNMSIKAWVRYLTFHSKFESKRIK